MLDCDWSSDVCSSDLGQCFTSLLTGYFGSGLIHDIYDYEPERIVGHPGEPVPLRFRETQTLSMNAVTLMRPHAEIIHRRPPETFSATLGMFIYPMVGDQHVIDMHQHRLCDYLPLLPSSRRVTLLRLAGLMGDDHTRELLKELSQDAPCWRTRLAALEAAAHLSPEYQHLIWELGKDDVTEAVRQRARGILDKHQ
jgi:hypothetical protein